MILAAAAPPAPGGAAAFRELAERIARGSTVVFLSPAVFAQGDKPDRAGCRWPTRARSTGLPAWLYHKDEWAKPHPIFDGLPAGGLLDYTFYRELIPDAAFVGQDPPAEAVAGGINATIGYSSGLIVAVYPLGAGRFVLNTLRIRENLGRHPAAERLLRNLLRYAGPRRGQAARRPAARFRRPAESPGLRLVSRVLRGETLRPWTMRLWGHSRRLRFPSAGRSC